MKIRVHTQHLGTFTSKDLEDTNEEELDGLVTQAVKDKLNYLQFNDVDGNSVYIPKQVLLTSIVAIIRE